MYKIMQQLHYYSCHSYHI